MPVAMNRPCRFSVLRLLAAAALIALFALARSSTASAADPTFKVEPSSISVDEGTQFVVRVTISNVQDLSAFEFNLDFDDRIVEYVSVTKGPFLENSGRSAACVPILSGDGDTLRYGCGTLGVSPAPPSGSGTLAEVTFRAVKAGLSQLRLSFSQITTGTGIADPAGGGIPGCTNPGGYCDTANGTVTVKGEEPLPTATPSEPTRPNQPGESADPPPQPSPNTSAPAGTGDTGSGSGSAAGSGGPSAGVTRPGGGVRPPSRGSGDASTGSPSGFAVAGHGPQQERNAASEILALAIAMAALGSATVGAGAGMALLRFVRR